MNPAGRGAAGFTLIEMLISLALILVATTALASYLLQSVKSNKSAQMSLSNQASVRNCMAMIQSVLRSAGWDPGDKGINAVQLDPFPADGTGQSIRVFVDLNGDGLTNGANEEITIQHLNGQIVWKTQQSAATYDVLADGITNDADQNGVQEPMFTPDSATAPTKITVKITGLTSAPDPRTGLYKTYTMTSDVVLRGRL